MIWNIFSAVDPIKLEEGVKKLRESHGIREATKEERESVNNYITDHSIETGIDFNILMDFVETKDTNPVEKNIDKHLVELLEGDYNGRQKQKESI